MLNQKFFSLAVNLFPDCFVRRRHDGVIIIDDLFDRRIFFDKNLTKIINKEMTKTYEAHSYSLKQQIVKWMAVHEMYDTGKEFQYPAIL